MFVQPQHKNNSHALAPNRQVPAGMTRPKAAIVVACRDAAAREVLTQELGRRYGGDYAIVVCCQPGELESRISELLAAGTPLALVIGGVGAQDPDGIEVLAAIRAIDPTASRVAAVRWGEFEAARPLFDAVTVFLRNAAAREPPRPVVRVSMCLNSRLNFPRYFAE